MHLRVVLVCAILIVLFFSSNQTSISGSQTGRVSTTQASSFQHAAGPSHSHSHSNSQSQYYHGTGILEMPQAASSVADSLSMTQSMMEDAEGRSIK